VYTRFLSENIKGRKHMEDLSVDGRIKWILKKQGGRVWIGFIWLRIGKGGKLGSCECGSEPSSSIKGRNFLTEQLLASQEGLCSMELVSDVTHILISSVYSY
jgi:hypothetical protein